MQELISRNPTKVILSLAAVLFLVVIIIAVLTGNVGSSVVVGGGFFAIGLLMHRSEDRTRDIGAATALMGQAIALTAALQGHPWQIDAHMLFFALLASLIFLRSIPAILMATAITAVHHLSFSVFLPTLVFPGGDLMENLGRTFLHAVVVLTETSVLILTVLVLNRLDSEMQERNGELEKTLRHSDQAREEAEAARQTAEDAQEQALAAQTRAEQLLLEAKESEKLRTDAENEHRAAQEMSAREVQERSVEQAEVVNIIREAMLLLQNGDLRTRIEATLPESYRDVGVAFNEAIKALDAAVGQVAVQSEEIQGQVNEIASAAAELAKRTEHQAQMLRESSEGLEELTNVVSNTEETVREADSSAQTAESSAKSSETVVSETASAMHAIQTEAEEISQIVKVIDEIAFQTNLLALNAGVEAARAGDAGRGFAVVASEVRALAQRSSESATSIRSLIERSGQQVQAGSAKIEETVGSLNSVLSAVVEITSKTGKISKGAQEQTAGILELNQKVAHLDTTTQQNAAMFEETSAACSNLENSARVLQDLTHKFRVSEGVIERSAVA